jgi:hypothetical protein
LALTLAGLFLGVLPVALGMLFYPALKSGGAVTFQFAMALTVGLLAFLAVDTLSSALEIAGRAHLPEKRASVWIIAALSCLLWGFTALARQEFTHWPRPRSCLPSACIISARGWRQVRPSSGRRRWGFLPRFHTAHDRGRR